MIENVGFSCTKDILGLVSEGVLWQFLDFFDNDLLWGMETFYSFRFCNQKKFQDNIRFDSLLILLYAVNREVLPTFSRDVITRCFPFHGVLLSTSVSLPRLLLFLVITYMAGRLILCFLL
jgi:hypothetical protein